MSYALKVSHLTKRYPSFALNDISFEVPEGCIMGFVGENGAGKTTTIKAILNLIAKDAGKVFVYSTDMDSDEKQAKRNIAVVFDDCCFSETLSISNVVRIMSRMYPGWDSRLFYEYADAFKLPEKKIIKEYSKGMKMKLSIASALACRAKLLILDEATSGLDPIVRSEIIDIFLEHIQNGQNSILFSTHITSDLDRIADYITFIHEGKIVFSEAKDAMLDSYAILKCEEKEFRRLDSNDIVGVRKNMFGYEVLTDRKNEVLRRQPGIVYEKALIEDIMLFYTKEDVR